MNTERPTFSIDKFELYVHRNKYELAARQLLILLNMLDSQYGAWGDIGTRPSNDHSQDRRDRHIIGRTVAAIGTLFADPEFKISLDGWGRSLFYHRWLQILFGACDFANADHVLHLMKADSENPDEMTYDDASLIKFSLLYSGDSQIPLQMEPFWNKHPQFAAGLFMAILSNRVVISEAAMSKKETLLEWLPEKIKEIELTDAHLPFLHDVWMHCSYAFTPKKHDIKEALNLLFRKRLLDAGCKEMDADNPPPKREKPVMVIPLEWFTSRHAMYRCYAPSLEVLRDKFHLIGIATPIVVDDVSKKIFHEVIEIDRSSGVLQMTAKMTEHINEIQPDIIYYPSIGMQLSVVALAALRLAPLQCMSLGHPATSRSDKIDFVVVREDSIGDIDRFSENIIAIPKDSMPYIPPHESIKIEPDLHENPDIVKIAVTASVMKLNPVFLSACRKIQDSTESEVQFNFFVGHGIGVTRHYITNAIDRYIPDAIVHPHDEYNSYITKLNKCDMFLDPFPFGNNNGIVDTVRQGLPGICMNGPEVHTHADSVLFRLLGLPEWTITNDADEYVTAACRMADSNSERIKLGKELLTIDPDNILFEGNPDSFAEAMWQLYNSKTAAKEKITYLPV